MESGGAAMASSLGQKIKTFLWQKSRKYRLFESKNSRKIKN